MDSIGTPLHPYQCIDMPKFSDLLTDEFGQSYDLIEVVACIGSAIGISLSIAKCFIHIDFNLMEYSGGLATMLTATAASRRIKPPAQPATPT